MALPGQTVPAHSEATCEECGKPAVKGIVGETDSFGSEYWWYCEEHYKIAKAEFDNDVIDGHCDWCRQYSAELKYRRDTDEGSSGPVYLVCWSCIDKDNERINQECDDE